MRRALLVFLSTLPSLWPLRDYCNVWWDDGAIFQLSTSVSGVLTLCFVKDHGLGFTILLSDLPGYSEVSLEIMTARVDYVMQKIFPPLFSTLICFIMLWINKDWLAELKPPSRLFLHVHGTANSIHGVLPLWVIRHVENDDLDRYSNTPRRQAQQFNLASISEVRQSWEITVILEYTVALHVYIAL